MACSSAPRRASGGAFARASCRRRGDAQVTPATASGGGAGGGAGSSGSGGQGGGGGGGEGKGDGGDSSKQPAGGLLQGWAERVAYDPEFPVKVLLEQVGRLTPPKPAVQQPQRLVHAPVVGADPLQCVHGAGSRPGRGRLAEPALAARPPPRPQIIGVGASVIGDMSSRPHWGLYELDFVFRQAPRVASACANLVTARPG